MKIIRNQAVEKALQTNIRVYLCGNLSQESTLKNIETSAYELGISEYPQFVFEKPHKHTFNTEYNYVIEGRIKIFLLDKKEELLFEKGDLFVIETNEPYVTKACAGTKVIFSKVPGGNDKELVPADEALTDWGRSWDATYISK